MQDSSKLLAAVHLAARKLASTGNFDELLKDVLAICVEAVGASGGTIYLHHKESRKLQFRHVLPEEVAETLQFTDIADDYGVAGSVYQSRKTVISQFEDSPKGEIEKKTGVTVRTMVTVPLMMEDMEPIGVVQLVNKHDGMFSEEDAQVLDTVSAVATMAFMNSQLMAESTRASQLLGMGKVGHDIKNLAFALEANVSFSDETLKSLREQIEDGSPPAELGYTVEAIETMFEELRLSIERITRYSVLISDLSAGKALQPDKKLAPLSNTIQLAAAYLESEGRSRHVKLCYDIQQDAPPLNHDEMYLFRIVQNLVSNAIKAVGETISNDAFDEDNETTWQQVDVRYRYVDGSHILEIEDHGPGMSQDTANSILSGNARSIWSKSTGSGWGTKIVLELAATHDAKVEIDSELGKGTTFRVAFPG